MKRVLTVMFLSAGVVGLSGPAYAAPDFGTFQDNDKVWHCSGDTTPGLPLLPADHCLNKKSRGNTGLIKVTSGDERWPQEGISMDPKSDTRPCPHDDASPDGTWWVPSEDGPDADEGPPWVCHHRPVK